MAEIADDRLIGDAILAGALAAIRRRAARQAGIAQSAFAVTESGVRIQTGEGAVAARLAEALAAAADEIERLELAP